jgi:hypothetical protein
MEVVLVKLSGLLRVELLWLVVQTPDHSGTEKIYFYGDLCSQYQPPGGSLTVPGQFLIHQQSW